ncbi:MAG: PEP-CTERM sorting domain-containing protein [Massilia sp.]
MNTTLRNAAATIVLAAGFAASASAGTLTFQGVTFNSSWSGNVLTLEIDAANRSGDWASATTIGALQLKDVGTFSNVELTSAPAGATNWTLSSNELNANGCSGGAHAGASLCYSGQHVALSDDMVFKFTFTGGAPTLESPHVKVGLFAGDSGRKVGSLLSENISPVPEPQTYAMLFGGLAVVGAMARRRKARK